MAESKKELLMRKLGCSAEEAEDIIKQDNAIDHNEKVYFDLDPQKEKEVQKKYVATRTRKTPIVFDKKPRERKENATKSGIIAEISEFLGEKSQFSIKNLQILNKERQISFQIGDETYEFTLVQKRRPKK